MMELVVYMAFWDLAALDRDVALCCMHRSRFRSPGLTLWRS